VAPPPPNSDVPPLDVAPVLNREFDPQGAKMSPEDYFVLTRVDGRASLRQIMLMVGFPEPHTLEILLRLRKMGAILLPGEAPPERRRVAIGTDAPAALEGVTEAAPPVRASPDAPTVLPPPARPTTPPPRASRPTPPPAPAPPPPAQTVRRRPSTQSPPSAADHEGAPERTPTPLPRMRRPSAIDPALLAETCDLSDEQKRAILVKHAGLAGATLFEILDLGPEADKKTIKRSYFRISKEFHPDRFFGKRLGSFEARLAEIFKAATEAYALLDDDEKREAYLSRLERGALAALGVDAGAMRPAAAQSKPARAAELFEAACQHEVTGDPVLAMKEFAAAVRLDPLPRYLRRAAEACLRSQELRSAEEYAKKFAALSPQDAQAHRTLAKVLRAQGLHHEALTELELAQKLDPESSHIAGELDEVRRLAQS
jgi:hypothetical protein